ncbi:hypothetical protein Tco_0281828 [Tanacetum coccineum]
MKMFHFDEVIVDTLDELKVAMESVRKMVLESRHLLHFKDFFQEGGICDGVDSTFDPSEEVVLLQSCLTEIRGFLEKFEGGYEEDMMGEEE